MNLFGYLPLGLMCDLIFENSDRIYGAAISEVLFDLLLISCEMDIFDEDTPRIPFFFGSNRRFPSFWFIFLFLIRFLNIN